MSWLTGWSYRKTVTITGQSGAGTNYQVDFSIGDAAGGDFNLKSHCTSFPNDIQVTDNNQTTPLDYWVEDLTVDPITIWVEVADDLGSNVDICVYYGKSGESSASSGTNTFEFFDDFGDNNIDTNKWDTSGATYNSVTETTGQLHLESTVDGQYLHSRGSILADFQIILKGKTTTNWLNIFPHSDGADDPWYDANQFGFMFDDFNSWIRIEHDGGRNTTNYNFATDTWYIMRATKVASALNLKLYDADDVYIDEVSATLTNAMSTRIPAFRCSGTGMEDYEYIRVRKYASPEPTFSSAGAEESAPAAAIPIFMHHYGNLRET